MAPVFSVLQKAFITNSKWQVLLTKTSAEQATAGSITWDLPGGVLDFSESLRDSLSRYIKAQTNLDLTTVSAPLNIITYLDWLDRSKQILRVIYLCLAVGTTLPSASGRELFWIESTDFQHYTFPDEGYVKAFETFSVHSQMASNEFLGLGVLNETLQYLRTQTTPL